MILEECFLLLTFLKTSIFKALYLLRSYHFFVSWIQMSQKYFNSKENLKIAILTDLIKVFTIFYSGGMSSIFS